MPEQLNDSGSPGDSLGAPVPPTWEQCMAAAQARAYSELVALHTSAVTIDAERARDLHAWMGKRVAAEPEERFRFTLRTDDVRQHLAAASEAALWGAVAYMASERYGLDPSDADKAAGWVYAAEQELRRQRRDLEIEEGDAADAMTRAFMRSDHVGTLRFIRHVTGALHEVARLREHRARG